MVSRNLRTTITIGGAIASSLPSSTKRAVAELNRLKVVQQEDVQEANRLKVAVRGLQRGSEEYKTRVQQLKDVQERINYRTDEIGRVGAASRDASGGVGGLTRRFSALRAGLGPAGLALGAVTGVVLALGAAFSKTGAEANDIILKSAQFGVSTEDFQRQVAGFRTFTQDAGQARQQVESLLKSMQDFRRVPFGEQLDPSRIVALSRLRINPNQLISGQLNNPLEFLDRLTQGALSLSPVEARLRVEQATGNANIAAIVAEEAKEIQDGNKTREQAFADAKKRAAEAQALSDAQLRQNQAMGQNIDEIKQKITELVRAVVTGLIPPIVAVARFFTGYKTPEELQAEGQARQQAAQREAVRFGVGLQNPDWAQGTVRNVTASEQRRVRGRVFDETVYGRPQNRYQDAGDFVIPQDTNANGAAAVSSRNVNLPTPIPQPVELPFVRKERGGRTQAGEITLVGERGPEIARFPGGTDIIPNSRLRGMMGGAATITQTLYVTIINPASELDIERSLVEAAGRAGAVIASA